MKEKTFLKKTIEHSLALVWVFKEGRTEKWRIEKEIWTHKKFETFTSLWVVLYQTSMCFNFHIFSRTFTSIPFSFSYTIHNVNACISNNVLKIQGTDILKITISSVLTLKNSESLFVWSKIGWRKQEIRKDCLKNQIDYLLFKKWSQVFSP